MILKPILTSNSSQPMVSAGILHHKSGWRVAFQASASPSREGSVANVQAIWHGERLRPGRPCAAVAWVLFLIVLLGTIVGARGADEPRINSFSVERGGVATQAVINLRATVPSNALVTVEARMAFGSNTWHEFVPGLFSAGAALDWAAPYFGGAQSFFRLKVEQFRVPLVDTGREFTLQTTNPVPLGLLLQAAGRAAGVDVFPVDESCDLFAPVGPVNASASTLEQLFRQIGCLVWTTPPAAEQPARYVPDPNLQNDPLPETPGTGVIEDGFPGISGRPEAGDGGADPQPLPTARNPLDLSATNAPDGFFPEEDLTRVPEGRYLRLTASLNRAGGAAIIRVRELPGRARRLAPPLPIGDEDVVCVVSSPCATNEPGGIYFIASFSEPFEDRSYDPPGDETSHIGHRTIATLRLPIPILDCDSNLTSTIVRFYKPSSNIEGETLDATVFQRNAPRFELLGELTGTRLLAALRTAAKQAAPKASAGAATITKLYEAGPRAEKYNFVFVGDGFDNTASDQKKFNDWVQMIALDRTFRRDIGPEILNAINIYRINTISAASGISLVNSNGTVTNAVSTALDYRYSGQWNRCWIEPGPNGVANLQAVIDDLLPETDAVMTVINQSGNGGCASTEGMRSALGNPFAGNWATLAHEFGHFFGLLGDEYHCLIAESLTNAACQVYIGAEPGKIDLTTNTVRSQIKWKDWIPSTRPIPTSTNHIADITQDVGLFVGGTIAPSKYWAGLYRPSYRGRMHNDASRLHNPIGYTAVREGARIYQNPDFHRNAVGDFDGDGRTDLVLQDGRQVVLHLSGPRDLGPNDPVTGLPPRKSGTVLTPTWYANTRVFTSSSNSYWTFRPNDILVPADFDGDGMTDLYCINTRDWAQRYVCMLKSQGTNFVPVQFYVDKLPGYGSLNTDDKFFTGDFDGDGRGDLCIFNGANWDMPYLGILRSTGTKLTYVRRYDRYLPFNEMGRHERFFVGDFNGDGKSDIATFNTADWNKVNFGIYTSDGAKLNSAQRHYGAITGGPAGGGFSYTMREFEQVTVGDFNGDGRSDFALFNAVNWSKKYLALFSSDASARLGFVKRFDDQVPGWKFKLGDFFHAADVNGDGKKDLVTVNLVGWNAQYFGFLRSTGTDLIGTAQPLVGFDGGIVPEFVTIRAADYYGQAHWDDLFIYSNRRFVMMRSEQTKFTQETVYPKWIHNHRYHGLGFW